MRRSTNGKRNRLGVRPGARAVHGPCGASYRRSLAQPDCTHLPNSSPLAIAVHNRWTRNLGES